MPTNTKIIVHGTFQDNGDSFLVMTRDRMILVDAPFITDGSLLHQEVSIIGEMGKAVGSPFLKLLADRIVTHQEIAIRAFEIFKSPKGGSAEENWLRAERELLGPPPPR